jgi:Ca-activated chloride channel family protein
VRLDVEIVVADGPPAVVSPCSPSHEMRSSAAGHTSRVALAGPARLDRDLVIRWQATRAAVGLSLVEGSGVAGDDDRYAVLTLTPPRVPEAAFPRDLTILIDASGSMAGEPLEQAKRVAEELIRGLASGDRFEVLAFANETAALTDGPTPAGAPAVDAALRRLRELRAGGGTEMTRALRRALEPLRPDSQRQVVLLTDGYIGFEREIVAELIEKLPERARLHVVGIGAAPNRALTLAASRAGRGVEVIVGSGDHAREAANRLQRHTAAPVLTEIRVGGSAVLGAAPDRPSDVLAGSPASFAILLRSGGGTIEVDGRLAGRAEPWRERIEVGVRPAADVTAGATAGDSRVRIPVGALYGRERVEDCEMKLAAATVGESDAILDEIEKLGIRHRIVTRRTSLVAISEEVAVDPRQPRRRERLAVEMPAGVSAEGVGLTGLPFAKDASLEFLVARSGMVAEDRILSVAHMSRSFRRSPRRVIIDGTIVRREHDLLIVEFEIPAQGTDIPKGLRKIQVEFEDGATCDGRLIPELSTEPGDHEPGLTVRLAIRLDDASARVTAAPRLLRWTSRRHGEVVIRLHAD